MADAADQEREVAFFQELVTRKWATEAQVAEARRLRDAALELGQDPDLDDIIVKKGWCTPEQVTQARRSVAARVGRSLRIGKYEIMGRLGEGGAGIVYRAYQTTLGREVALKVLSKEREGQEEYLDRFLREARVAVTLNHVNIVRGLDFGHADGYHYFAMELVEGESFLKVIQREGRLSEDKAIDAALQMVRALEHAQTYRIVHRDIKPENILITKTGTAKLCDLGLARPIIEGGASDASGRPMGTALYVAPEQIRHEGNLDFRADIYSLGATLFHALTGAPPFAGKTSGEIVRRHLEDPVPNPRDRVLEVSTGAASVVVKMLAKKPDERYQSLESLSEDLEAVLDGRPPVNTITMGRKAAPMSADAAAEIATGTRRPAAQRGGKGGTIALVAISLAAVGGAAFFVLRPKKEEPPPAPPPVEVQPPEKKSGTGIIDRSAVQEARENEAAAALAEAEALARDAEETDPAVVEKMRAVATSFADTAAGRVAATKADELDRVRKERIKTEIESRRFKATRALSVGDLKDAYAAWGDIPTDLAGSAVEKAAEAGRAAVIEAAKAALAKADAAAAEVIAGDESGLEGVRKALGEMAATELPEVADAATRRLGEVEASVQSRVEAMRLATETWAEATPRIILATKNGLKAAQEELEKVAPTLAPLGERLKELRGILASAETFRTAIRKGFEQAASEGATLRLRVASRPGGLVAGRASAVRSEQFEIQRGPAVETVDIEAVHPEDLAALAWKVLGAGSVSDHRGAAVFHLARGAFPLVAVEIAALDVVGGKDDSALVIELRERVLDVARRAADAVLKEAEVLRLQKRLPEARDAYARAVALCDGYARPLWMQGAFLLGQDRDPAPALALLEKAVALDAEEADAWFHLAAARRKAGDPEKALEAVETFVTKAEADNPLRGDAAALLEEVRATAAEKAVKEARDAAGRAYRKEEWAESEAQWSRVLKFAPDDLEALYFLGKSCISGGKVVDGYVQLRDFLARQKTGGSRVEDAKRVVKDLEQRLSGSPAAQRKILEAANLINQKKYREAIAPLDDAIELTPLNADAWMRRGTTMQQLFTLEGRKEDLNQAARDLETSLRINDREGFAWTQLALVRFTAEDWKGTVAAATVAAERDPKSGVACEVLARSFNRLKRWAEAEEAAIQGIKRGPTAMHFLARGEARIGLGKLEEARSDLDAAELKYELTPGERAFRATILGRLMQAEKDLER